MKEEDKELSKVYLTRLLDILKANKIAEQDFAKAIGINRNSIYKWKMEERIPQWFAKSIKMFRYLNKINGFEPMLFFAPDFNPNQVNEYNEKIKRLEIEMRKLCRSIEHLEKQKLKLMSKDCFGIPDKLISNIKNAEENKQNCSYYHEQKKLLADKLYDEFVKLLKKN